MGEILLLRLIAEVTINFGASAPSGDVVTIDRGFDNTDPVIPFDATRSLFTSIPDPFDQSGDDEIELPMAVIMPNITPALLDGQAVVFGSSQIESAAGEVDSEIDLNPSTNQAIN